MAGSMEAVQGVLCSRCAKRPVHTVLHKLCEPCAGIFYDKNRNRENKKLSPLTAEEFIRLFPHIDSARIRKQVFPERREAVVSVSKQETDPALLVPRPPIIEFIPGFVFSTPLVKNICDIIEHVAPTNLTVLVSGETGTGKELVARAIHEKSDRREKPFVTIDCTSLLETLAESELFGHERGAFTDAFRERVGLFEAAQGGTVFIDEVSELPCAIQKKLLRVLETHTVRRVGNNRYIELDFRVVAATNRRLEALVWEGRFREDLYYRLRGDEIRVPPLRDRIDDISPLVHHFAERAGALVRLMPDALEALRSYSWPGNVRANSSTRSNGQLFLPQTGWFILGCSRLQ